MRQPSEVRERELEATNASAQAGTTRAWVDIENPPQVQYLVPLVDGLTRSGHDVLVTARDYGSTLELLAARDIDAVVLGRHFGSSKVAKVTGNLRRVRGLRRAALKTREARPEVVLSASRSAALAARSAGIPSVVLCDYEHVDFSAFRATRSYIVHPNVIPTTSFTGRGISAERLLPFSGIKEDITFADLDLDEIAPVPLPELDGVDARRVLVRPPASESHYYRAASGEIHEHLLAWLAARDDVVVVYSPRYVWQADALSAHRWRNRPLVLERAVDFVGLYKNVDVVISGGGTMTREAAYLGVPAVSVFQGSPGGVDNHLESLGRLTHVRSAEDLQRVDLGSLRRTERMTSNSGTRDDVLDSVLRVARRARAGARQGN